MNVNERKLKAVSRTSMLVRVAAGAGVIALSLLAGCESAQQKAVDQAKAQAKATNTPQEVQYVNSSGATVTTVVQPPAAAGQPEQIATQTTPPPPGPKPAATTPVITPLPPGATLASSPAAGSNGADAYNAPNGAAPEPNGQPAAGPSAPAINLTIPAGTELAIRINQDINVKHVYAGDHFSGEVVEPVTDDGTVVIPRGTVVHGRIDAAHRRGHFKGRSILELSLVSMTLNGYEYPLDTHRDVWSKRGKGRRTAGFIGGLTGVGMLIGGVASGGAGLAIGAASGAGAGTLLAGVTGNRDINIPAESIVHFRLEDQLVVQNP